MILFTLILAVLIVAIDQLSKIWALEALSSTNYISGIPGLLDFVYVENTGAAFGILPDQRYLFIILALIFLIIAGYVLLKIKFASKIYYISMALIIGGAIGNLIDRIMRGFVIDFLKLSFFPPVCNFADYCLTIGAVMLTIHILFFSSISDNNKRPKGKRKNEYKPKEMT